MRTGAYFAFRDRPQRLDYTHLSLHVRRLIDPAHDNLHHLGNRLLELAMFLAQQLYLLVEQAPVTAILAYCHDRD